MTYDEHPTDPRHGGKMTVEQMATRIVELEAALLDLVRLERTFTPDMSGKRRVYAMMQNGKVLADALNRARELVTWE